MSSTQNAEPVGFFSLPRELRDQIYDILHCSQEVADFGSNKQLEIRYPLPRLHQISRRFATECDMRAASPGVVAISQKHKHFLPGYARVRCPKIVHLRHRRTRRLVQNLHIDLHVLSFNDGTAVSHEKFNARLSERLVWAHTFISNNCSNPNADKVRIRFMINRGHHIHKARVFIATSWVFWHCFRGKVEMVMKAPSDQEDYGGDFESATLLGVWVPGWNCWKVNRRLIKLYEEDNVLELFKSEISDSSMEEDSE